MYVAAALCLATVGAAAQDEPPATPLKWAVAPALFPKGAQIAVITGDPVTPGPFTALLSMPDGYRMPPHFHTTDEHVEVKQGTLLVGMGDKLDVKQTKAMAVGDTGTAPAGMHHFAAAKGATIISVSVMAPYVMTYVNPRDEPWHTFPFGY
jgi:hypothetical protein